MANSHSAMGQAGLGPSLGSRKPLAWRECRSSVGEKCSWTLGQEWRGGKSYCWSISSLPYAGYGVLTVLRESEPARSTAAREELNLLCGGLISKSFGLCNKSGTWTCVSGSELCRADKWFKLISARVPWQHFSNELAVISGLPQLS